MSDAIRPRRLRGHGKLREMVTQVRLAAGDFVMPLFITAGKGVRKEVGSMPGVFQLSMDKAVEELKRLESLGVGSYILFGVTEAGKKDAVGSYAHDENNEVCRTLKAAKDAGVGMVAITDLCYCEYTNHGHCGPLTGGKKPGARSQKPEDGYREQRWLSVHPVPVVKPARTQPATPPLTATQPAIPTVEAQQKILDQKQKAYDQLQANSSQLLITNYQLPITRRLDQALLADGEHVGLHVGAGAFGGDDFLVGVNAGDGELVLLAEQRPEDLDLVLLGLRHRLHVKVAQAHHADVVLVVVADVLALVLERAELPHAAGAVDGEVVADVLEIA